MTGKTSHELRGQYADSRTHRLAAKLIRTVESDEKLRSSRWWNVWGVRALRDFRIRALKRKANDCYDELASRYRSTLNQIMIRAFPNLSKIQKKTFRAGLEMRLRLFLRTVDDWKLLFSGIWRAIEAQIASDGGDLDAAVILKRKFMLRQFLEGIRDDEARKAIFMAYKEEEQVSPDARDLKKARVSYEFLHRALVEHRSDLSVLTDGALELEGMTAFRYHSWLYPD